MNMRTLVVGVGALLAIGSTQAADTLAKICLLYTSRCV